MKFETRAVHAGLSVDENTGAIAPPIHLSTTFGRDEASQPIGRHTYIRESNPNQERLEQAVAELEGGEAGLAFASGMAAGAAVFEALEPGTHMVIPDDVYYGFGVAAQEFCNKWGITFDAVPMEDLDQLSAAIRPETGLIWVETPSNPLLKVVDIRRITALARQADATTIVDNTFATPVLLRPLDLGVDFVVHSMTKYLAGHGDIMGGALICKEEHRQLVTVLTRTLGPNLGPFEAYLTMRGIKTLPLRVERQCQNARRVAAWLSDHPRVERVYFPGDPEHPDIETSRRLFPKDLFGGMVSFEIKDAGRDEVFAFMDALKMIVPATTLGDVHSLVLYPAISTHRDLAPKHRARIGIRDNLVRVSVGIEAVEDIEADLDQALKQ